MDGLGELFPKSAKKITSANNIILIVLVVVAALASMGELSISVTKAVDVSLLVIFLYIVCSLMYSNKYAVGMQKTKEDEEYIEAKEKYDASVKEIYDLGLLSQVPELCIRYREEDLKARRSELLGDQCITYKNYDENYRGATKKDLEDKGLSREAIRCIRRADKLKGMHLNGRMLMSDGEGISLIEHVLHVFGFRPGIGVESKTQKSIDYGVNLVTRMFTTLFAGVIGIKMLITGSWDEIAQWAMRMFPIAWSALAGYNAGARNITDTLIPQMQRKTAILELFAVWGKTEPQIEAAGKETEKNKILVSEAVLL